MKEQLQNLFLTESADTIITRLQTVIPEYKVRELLKPVVINATIVDEEKVIDYIKSIWPFKIKNLEINLKSQELSFKIYGECYVPKRYSGFNIFKDEFSLEETEEFNYHRIIKEEYAEKQTVALAGVPGIKLEYV